MEAEVRVWGSLCSAVPFQWVWETRAVQLPWLVMETAQLTRQSPQRSFSFRNIIEWAHKVHINHGCALAQCLPAAPFRELPRAVALRRYQLLSAWKRVTACLMHRVGGKSSRDAVQSVFWNTEDEVERNSLQVGKKVSPCITQQKLQVPLPSIQWHVAVTYALLVRLSQVLDISWFLTPELGQHCQSQCCEVFLTSVDHVTGKPLGESWILDF